MDAALHLVWQERKHGCFASLSMTIAMSFRALFSVIPSGSEESSAWMLRCT